jgi:poly-gamma-glutamate synthesis protein (capsule biosynthesis protein)
MFRRKNYKTSRPVEGNSADFAKGEAIWWAYKHFIKAIEEPEHGKGIEEYFLNNAPVFSAPSDFNVKDTVTISAGGDIMPSGYINSKTADHLWDDISDFFFSADLSCANLEAPVNIAKPLGLPGKNIVKPPAMNISEEIFDICWRGGKGITFYSTANNHSMDQGEEGLIKTLDFLDNKKVSYVGTARTPEEQDDIPVLTFGNLRVAFLGYTFSLNRQKTPSGKEYMANLLRLNRPDCDISLIRRQIEIARNKKADVIIANIHWSLEYESFPVQNVIDMGHKILESGVDIILGNHPHTLQTAQRYEWKEPVSGYKKSGLIIYALGNLTNVESPVANCSLAALASITIQKGELAGEQRTLITDVRLLPVYHYLRLSNNRCIEARLLNLYKLKKSILSGQCPFILTDKQKREILRLCRLSERLMPYVGY